MIGSNQIDYTTEARWRNEIDLNFMPEPEEAGESEAPTAVGEESQPDNGSEGEDRKKKNDRGRATRRYSKSQLPSYMGKHVDFFA
ncbi:MAG TPA: hypothetical protein VMW73_09950 [Spirochaetia bacterium]|nr:hypothetical protein [Spirochaetia bacterium]